MPSDFKDLPLADALDCADHLCELKIDGTRLAWDGAAGTLTSNRGVERSARYPRIVEELRRLPWSVRGEIAVPGGNIHDVNQRVNWPRAQFYAYDQLVFGGVDYSDASAYVVRAQLEGIFRDLDVRPLHLGLPPVFSSPSQGWDYVKRQRAVGAYAEGIVLKGPTGTRWKTKFRIEVKVPIVGYEPGKTKGAFVIELDGVRSKVTARSADFAAQYQAVLALGHCPWAEIDYLFLTTNGAPFQPRLRRVGTRKELTL